MDDVGLENAVSGEGAGIAWKRDSGDAELLGHRDGVQPAGTAEGEQGEVARIEPLLEEAETDRRGEVGIGDGEQPGGGRLDCEAERRGDAAGDGVARRGEIERHGAAEEIIGIQPAEHQIGIGYRRLTAAMAIADRAWPRAGDRKSTRLNSSHSSIS